MSRTGRFEKKEPEVLEKLIKLAGEGGVADNFTEGDEFPEENAAVLERLEKNGATRMNKTDRVRCHPSSLFYEFVIDH